MLLFLRIASSIGVLRHISIWCLMQLPYFLDWTLLTMEVFAGIAIFACSLPEVTTHNRMVVITDAIPVFASTHHEVFASNLFLLLTTALG